MTWPFRLLGALPRSARWGGCCGWVVLFVAGCHWFGEGLEGEADPSACNEAFDDHTHVGRVDLSTLRTLADTTGAPTNKFIITALMTPDARTVRFLEQTFFTFHDEWYWFRLLNGESACGASTDPVEGAYPSIDAVYDEMRERDELPLDLTFLTGGRLYSSSFYDFALRQTPRVFGVGTLSFDEQAQRFDVALQLVDFPTALEREAMNDALNDVLPFPVRADDPE